MRPILIILIFFTGTVLSRYHEKRRFDRSVNDDDGTSEGNTGEKQWIFIDYETNFRAYRDKAENNCYLERLTKNDANKEELPRNEFHRREQSKILYVAGTTLTKLEGWRVAGGRVINFCQGRNIYLLQDTKPIPEQVTDPFLNEIPKDENDIVIKRVADVVLTPLKSRAKRQIMLEEREKLNENLHQIRSRRQATPMRGRFRGQTQSQYLNIGGEDQKEGKAEAEATQQSSRAIVSGSRGMGQAQSMSSGGSGCEDCPGYPGYSHGEITPDRYTKFPSATGTDTSSGIAPGGRVTYPAIGTPGSTGGLSIPSQGIPPGTSTSNGRITGRGDTGVVHPEMKPGTGVYPGNIPSAQYPANIPGTPPAGRVSTYPGIHPGMIQPGGGVLYPVMFFPGSLTTGETYPSHVLLGTGREGAVYPGGVMPGIVPPGSGTTYPTGIPSGTARGGGVYPGGVIPGTVTTGTGGMYPGTVQPGTVIPGGGVMYPGAVVPGTGRTGSGTAYPGGALPSSTIGGEGVAYPGGAGPGAPTIGSGVIYPGGVAPGTVPTGTGTTYPGGLVPGTIVREGGATYPGGVVPGTVSTGTGITYPGGLVPGTIAREGGATYPGGVVPGTVLTERDGTYPSSGVPGTIGTGGGAGYPGGVIPRTMQTGVDARYPGGVIPGTMQTGVDGRYPGGVVPGPPTSGTYPGSMIPGAYNIYPAGAKDSQNIPGTTLTGSTATAGTVLYPGTHVPGGGVPGTGKISPVPGESGTTGERIAYPGMPLPGSVPGVSPGVITTGGEGSNAYPGSVPLAPGQPISGVVYPGGVVPGSVIPGAIGPGGTTYPGGILPESGTTRGNQMYIQRAPPGSLITGQPIYPGGISPGPGFVGTYPSTGVPGTGPGGGPGITTTGAGAGTLTSYPSNTYPATGQTLYPPGIQPGPGVRPDQTTTGQGGYPGSVQRGDGTTQLGYPGGGVVQYPVPGEYPGGVVQVPQLTSGYPVQPGQYPVGTTWQRGQSPGSGIGGVQVPTTTIGGQYPSGKEGASGVKVPGGQYPNGVATGIEESSQYYQQPRGPAPSEDDGSDSQASSSVKQVDSGTQASASAQGKFGQGVAQSQVTGTYSGSGSFSAQAGSSDINKGAQTEISGGKEGAKSNAQGTGGHGKSQAQVQLDSESGATSTGAQSSGWNHGTNSQVQASSKGGMADAQANGEGSTSSQAQIGFQPYLKTDEKLERRSRPFRGGGTASAQSGTYRGQSQSQLEGSFQYGITYSGAAQAGSGSGAAASRRPFNFSATDTELFKSFKPYDAPTILRSPDNETTNTSADLDYSHVQNERGLQTSSSSRKTVITNVTKNNSETSTNMNNQSVEKSRVDNTIYDANADYDEEYDEEDYDSSMTQGAMNSKISTFHNGEQDSNKDHQSQMMHISTGNQYDVRVNQDSNTPQANGMLQPGQSLPGYTVPPGFRGRVTSLAGSKTISQGDGKSQSQTVSLVPTGPNVTRENKSPISETRSLQTNHERLAEHHVGSKQKNQGTNFSGNRHQEPVTEHSLSTSIPIKPTYYTITNSVAGKMDGSKNSPRKYEHRYYTKSSTCGYFTFSCNVVYGSNGRTKICKPKVPTYSDGTPMKC